MAASQRSSLQRSKEAPDVQKYMSAWQQQGSLDSNEFPVRYSHHLFWASRHLGCFWIVSEYFIRDTH